MMRIVSRLSGQGDPLPFRMLEIPVASLASPVDETGFYEIGNDLTDFSWHA
jgi:hypothetical protein